MTTLEQINYIKNIYNEWNVINDDIWFNPNIDTDKGYIPICSQCSSDYEKFKTMNVFNNIQVEMKHPSSCLWYDWFIKKIKMVCPTIKIVKKIT